MQELMPKVPRAMGESPRRKDIQGLRAIAVTFVVYYHAGLPFGGGFVGVDVFFVISGFVITAMLQREYHATGRLALGTFYGRRFRRLTPALAVAVAFTLAGSAMVLSPLATQDNLVATAIGALGLFANVMIARTTGGYFDAAASTNPLLHTWTLSLEEQFYLVFPFVLLLGWWVARRTEAGPKGPLLVVSAFAALSLTIALVTSGTEFGDVLPAGIAGFYGPVGRAWEFAAGSLLALAGTRLRRPSYRSSTLLATIGLGLLAICFTYYSGELKFPGPATVLPVAATVMLIHAGSNKSAPVSRMLALRPIVLVGNVSYSWYLWHWPFIVFAAQLFPGTMAALPLAALLSLIPASISYRWIEQPLARMRLPSRRTMYTLVAATLAVPLLLAGSLGVAVSQNYWSERVEGFRSSQALHAGELAGCMSRDALTASTQDSCLWNGTGKGTPIYLVGDSIADHYSEGLIKASNVLDRPLTITTAAACTAYHLYIPEIDAAPARDLAAGAGCANYVNGTLDWLDSQPSGLVIIASNDVVGWNPSEVIPTIPAFDIPAELKAAAITEGLTSTVDRLHRVGHTTMIAKAPPSYRFPAPGWSKLGCNTATIVAGSCFKSATVQEMDELQGPTRKIIDSVARDTGSSTLDFRDFFCPSGICSTQRGDVTLYLDDIHISVTASAQLAPLFEVVLANEATRTSSD